MSNDPPKRETMSVEEATVSNMWEIDGRNSLHGIVRRRQLRIERQ